eukprot:CAMPEP_0197024978 /NCGR_PEP_ID=MMETSP1384-20130603/5433_1 /TAXON_ID=29189 /ORGANISM="Ammonia sp." /LENGTH=803 /DNA_ID=CAMNT_0042453451 /DNA_START=25 /DNA_END=2436 /DNA_ORIENTATION=+
MSHLQPALDVSDHDSLSPQLKERRRQKMKYFASTDDLNKSEIMNFLQNEIKRKTSMNENENEHENEIDIESDCKDDFDSDAAEHEDDGEEHIEENATHVHVNMKENAQADDESDVLIRNGEEPSWNELILDDSTRQQFEELAREYVGNIAEEKKKLQSEHYQLQQEHLKLQETNKAHEEHIEKLNAEIEQKEETMLKLEQEISSLNVDKQTLYVDQQKLELQVQHNEETIENLNATISEYKVQNEVLSQNLNELTIKLDETQSPHTLEHSVANKSGGEEHHEEYEKLMNNVELAFKTNNKQMMLDIVNSFKLNAVKTNDEIIQLRQQQAKLNSDKNELQKEQQSLTLNNEALKNLVETHQERLKNVQKQHENLKNAYSEMKQLNEQSQIDINAKQEFIEQLKQQNQKLESSNQELLIMNSDLRHELEMYDQTILKGSNAAQAKQRKASTESKESRESKESKKKNCNKTASPQQATMIALADRKSFDDNENESDHEPDMPSLILTHRDADNDGKKQRRSYSIPTSLYEQNLDIIVKSVNEDEFKFMEDLSKEKATLQARPIRSEILKRCHSDAEKEFFFMNVLTCKLEITLNLGVSNPIVSDVSPQTLWLNAQQDNIPLHQFHEFIKKSLIQILQRHKSSNEQIKHHWSSQNSMIADQLKQNDLNRSKQSNPHLQLYQNGHGNAHKARQPPQATKRAQKRRNHGKQRVRAYTVTTVAPYSEKQTLVDEDEEEIIQKHDKKQRRDSEHTKQIILQSYQQREKEQQQQQQQQIQQPTQEEYDQHLDAIQTQKTLNNLKVTDTYDLL